jgi:hypothetical protein
MEILFCLFSNFCGSKPTRTRTQNTEKQRNGLIHRVVCLYTKQSTDNKLIYPYNLCLGHMLSDMFHNNR